MGRTNESVNTQEASPSRKSRQSRQQVIRAAVRSMLEGLETRTLLSGANPVASTGGPYTTNEGTYITITGASSTDSDGSIVLYQWDTNYNAGNGFHAGFSGQFWRYYAVNETTRTVALKVTDNDGNTNITSTTITVNDVAPTINITSPATSAEGAAHSITWSYTDPGTNDVATAWSIDWGDDTAPTTVAGDVTTSSHVYRDDGDYTISLTATQPAGTTTQTVAHTVTNVVPLIEVSADPTSLDEGGSTSLTFGSSNRGQFLDSYVVEWGDGDIDVFESTSSAATHTYADDGAYTVTVTGNEHNAQSASGTIAVNVANVSPIVALTGVSTSGTEGSSLSAGSTATDPGVADTLTYGWTVYRDGSVFTLPGGVDTTSDSLTFTPTDNGSYVMRLTVVDSDNGSTTVNSDPIIVANANPTASISGTPVGSIDEGDTVSLTVTPADAGTEDTFAYAWTVTKDGDDFTLPEGATTNAANFSFIPTDNGAYVATCVVTDDDAGTVTVASASITVDNVDPSASISVEDTTVDEGSVIGAEASANDAGSADTHSYSWSVTKGGAPYVLPGGVNTSGATLAFVPSDNGTYVLTCVVTDDDTGTDTATSANITVANVAPTGEMEAPTDGTEGQNLSFSIAAADAGSADIFAYSWSVTKNGDPYDLGVTTTTDATLNFSPDDNGTYVVSCVISDDDGDTVTVVSSPITVANVNPQVAITGAATSADEGDVLNFGSTASDVAEDTLSYSWSVTKGGATYSLPGGTDTSSSTFSYTPGDNGAYVVSLTVTDEDGGSTTVTTDPITVANVNPTGTISGEPIGTTYEGDTVTLTMAASDDGADDTLSYSWSVTKDGDAYDLTGVTTNASTLSFDPNDNGAYVATCIVSDDDSGTVTVNSTTITITNADPTGSISVEDSTVDEGSVIGASATVADAGTVDTHTYSWSVTKGGLAYTLPGGVNTTSATFAFTPSDNGTYVLSCDITDDDGGTVTVTSGNVTVSNVAPTAELTGDTEGTEGTAVNLGVTVTDPGSADTFTYGWTLTQGGDPVDLTGVTTNTASFSFTPDDEGTYVATLTVTDDDGDSTTVSTDPILVTNVAPAASITTDPTTGNEGSALTFVAIAPDAGTNDTVSYGWTVYKNEALYTLPGGTDTTSLTLTFTPDDNGTYVARFTALDNDGGSSTVNSAGTVVGNVNPTGSISGEPLGTTYEGDTVSLSVSATDAGTADTLSYTWSVTQDGDTFALPEGTDVHSASFDFVPTDNGAYVATVVIADDDGGTSTQSSSSITITNADPTATMNVTLPGSMTEGQTISAVAVPADAGSADTFTYSWSVTKDGNPLTLTGVTTDAASFSFVAPDNGDYVLTVVVTDDDGADVTEASSTITLANAAPTAEITGDASVAEGSAITFGSTVTDPGVNDTQSYAWSVTDGEDNAVTLPGGTVTNAANFTFTPTVDDAYTIHLTVTDNDGDSTSVTKALTGTNVNPTVTITGAPVTARAEGYTVNLASHFTDPGADDTAPTYSWTVTKNGATYTLPGGTTTNAANFTFDAADNGTFIATVVVTDSDGGTGTSSSTMTITNAAPFGEISGAPGAAIYKGTAVNLTMTADDPGADDTFTYAWSVTRNGSAYTLPGGTTTNAANFSFTPTQTGNFIATCAVTDDDGASVNIATAAIVVQNHAPTSSITTAPSGDVNEGSSASFEASGSDADGDTLSYSWSVTKDGDPFALPGGTNTAGPSFTFVPTDEGDYVASVVVSDTSGATSTSQSNVTVVNVAPSASITAPATGTEGTALSFTSTATDPGAADTLSYSWSVTKDGSGYSLAGVTTNASTFGFTPIDQGSYVVSLTVTDNGGAHVTTTTDPIAVANANPTLTTSGPTTGTEGSAITFTSNAHDAGVNDTLTYGWTVRKSGVVYTLPGEVSTTSSTLAWTPRDNGSYVVRLTVIDSDGGTVTVNSPAITVANVNPTGSISGTPETSLNRGDVVELSATGSDVGEDDTLGYAWTVTKNGSAYTLPGETVTDEAGFSFTPTEVGTYVATCVISDDDAGTFSVSTAAISVVNRTPTASVTAPEGSVDEGDTASLSVTASDADDDALTYSWSVTKDGNAFTLPEEVATNASTLDFVPTDEGSYVATVVVTDTLGATTTASGTVTAVNVDPTVGLLVVTSETAIEGSPVSLAVGGSDRGAADTLSFSWNVNFNGDSVATGSGETYAFTPADNGTYTVTVTVSDGDGGTATGSTEVTVGNVAPIPSITGSTEGLEGVAQEYSATSTDAGTNDTASYVWSITKDGDVYGESFEGSTLSFMPDDNGTFVITVTATDNDGDSSSASRTVVISNTNPTVAIANMPTDALEGDLLNFGANVEDPSPVDTLSSFDYQWTLSQGETTIATSETSLLEVTAGLHGTYTLTLRVTDKDGGFAETTETLEVGNVAPSEAAISGLPTNPVEGDTITLTGSASDFEGDSLGYNWSVSRNGVSYTNGTGVDFSFVPSIYGTYDVTLTVTDTGGLSTSTTETIEVANQAPTATLTAPTGTQLLNRESSFSALVGDVPTGRSMNVRWQWGDGSADVTTTSTGGTIAQNHTFTATGTFTVTLTVTDDGGSTTTRTSTVSVGHAALQTDPVDSTKTALYIVGTNANDGIRLITTTGGAIRVQVNGVTQPGSFSPTGRIIIYGDGGANAITMASTITNDSIIFAGNNASTVWGAAGNDFIYGGRKNDVFFGGEGKDILVGGNGSDSLTGDAGDDLIVAGDGTWTGSISTIASVMAEWKRTDNTFSAKVSNLRNGGGSNGSTKVNSTTTQDDAVPDTLTGGTGRDWIWATGSSNTFRDFLLGSDLLN